MGKRKKPRRKRSEQDVTFRHLRYGGMTFENVRMKDSGVGGLVIGNAPNSLPDGPVDMYIGGEVSGLEFDMESRGKTAIAGGTLIDPTGRISHDPGKRGKRGKSFLVPPRKWKGET